MPRASEPIDEPREPDLAQTLLSLNEQISTLTKLLANQRPKPVKLSKCELEDGFYLTAKVNKSTVCIPSSPAAGAGGGTVQSIEGLASGALLVTTLEGEIYFVSPAMVRKGLVLVEEK